MSVIIYHNPRCSKSRQTLALLRDKGLEPEVIEYMKQPPSPETLRSLLDRLGMTARELVRRNEEVYRELALEEKGDRELVDAMCREPRLIQRPIVVHGNQARLGRPPEAVLEILDL